MDILSDAYINWYLSTHTVFISGIKWLVGSPVSVYIVLKLLAIMNRNVPTNKIIDLLQNSFGKEKKDGERSDTKRQGIGDTSGKEVG